MNKLNDDDEIHSNSTPSIWSSRQVKKRYSQNNSKSPFDCGFLSLGTAGIAPLFSNQSHTNLDILVGQASRPQMMRFSDWLRCAGDAIMGWKLICD